MTKLHFFHSRSAKISSNSKFTKKNLRSTKTALELFCSQFNDSFVYLFKFWACMITNHEHPHRLQLRLQAPKEAYTTPRSCNVRNIFSAFFIGFSFHTRTINISSSSRIFSSAGFSERSENLKIWLKIEFSISGKKKLTIQSVLGFPFGQFSTYERDDTVLSRLTSAKSKNRTGSTEHLFGIHTS